MLWKRLKHPNVLPFLGVSTTLFQFCMVSDWIPHGNVVEFLRENPEANRFSLVSKIYIAPDNFLSSSPKASRCYQRASLSARNRFYSRGSERSTELRKLFVPYSRSVAKYPRRCLRACSSRRFWGHDYHVRSTDGEPFHHFNSYRDDPMDGSGTVRS